MSQTKIIIVCSEHGEFFQTPNSHLDGHGCRACKVSNSRTRIPKPRIPKPRIPKPRSAYQYGLHKRGRHKSNTQEFVSKARLIHGDKYNYSLVDYQSSSQKVTIICPDHGEFFQSPNVHITKKAGCPACGYLNRLRNDGCNIGLYSTLSTQEFIVRARLKHGGLFDYSKVDYKDTNTKVTLTCFKHGDFHQTPKEHLRGRGCPRCNASKAEVAAWEYLDQHGYIYQTQVRFDGCRKTQCLPFDIQVSLRNGSTLLIEIDGDYHRMVIFQDDIAIPHYVLESDEIKNQYCINNNLNLVRIQYFGRRHSKSEIDNVIRQLEAALAKYDVPLAPEVNDANPPPPPPDPNLVPPAVVGDYVPPRLPVQPLSLPKEPRRVRFFETDTDVDRFGYPLDKARRENKMFLILLAAYTVSLVIMLLVLKAAGVL